MILAHPPASTVRSRPRRFDLTVPPPLLVAVLAVLSLLVGARPALGQREVMHASAVAQRSVSAPGDRFAIAVILDFEDGWHAWPNKPVLPKGLEDLTAIPTEVRLGKGAALPAGVRVFVDDAQWPEAHEVESAGFTGEPITILSYSGRAVVYVPVVIGADATPGKVTLPLEVPYQACDDSMCMQPTSAKVTVGFEIGAGEAAIKNAAEEKEFAGFDAGVFSRLPDDAPAPPAPTPVPGDAGTTPPPPSPAQRPSLFGYELPDPSGPAGIAVLLLVSIIGGAILNLTPCVLPVIPIKVMTLTQHAQSGHTSALKLGLWMSLGIVAFWTALGIPVAAVAGFDPSTFIFGRWWVTFSIGLVIVLMALGIMGMFNITLPQSVYAVNPKADTPWGSFVFGVMTAILGLPCFGFVAGGLLVASATMPAIATLSVFFGMGVGMAAPFLVLSAKPQLVSKMPRTGPASELVKQVMGLLLLAAAAFFIASGLRTLIVGKPYVGQVMHWWGVAFFLALAGLWLAYRTFQITPKPVRRAVFSLIALALAGVGVAMAWSETRSKRENYLKLMAANPGSDSFVTGAWNPYTPGKFELARASNRIVIADFTADWCLICKSLRKSVLNPDPVYSEITKDDVVLLEVDCSDAGLPGSKFLNSLGRTGIPTLAIFTPGVEEPEIFNAYTASTVLGALERARARAMK